MRRTLVFLKWKSSAWSNKVSGVDPSLSPVCEGLYAYAFRQAAVFASLHDHFFSLWKGFKTLGDPSDQPAPTPAQPEEAIQGMDGGDADS